MQTLEVCQFALAAQAEALRSEVLSLPFYHDKPAIYNGREGERALQRNAKKLLIGATADDKKSYFDGWV